MARRRAAEIRAACPTLVIDDEADQASVNTGRASPTSASTRPSGSASPDAKDGLRRLYGDAVRERPHRPAIPDDLYPRDFIVDLPRPQAYFGAEQLFGRDRLRQDEDDEAIDGLDVVRRVPDGDVEKVKPAGRSADGFEPTLPDSLVDALDYFVVAAATRAARGRRTSTAPCSCTRPYSPASI